MRAAWVTTLVIATACGGSARTDGGAPDAFREDAGQLPAPMASTSYGELLGERGDGFQAFLGIPYAAPPVGALRFRMPEPAEPWSTPRPARRRPPRCVQGDAFGIALPGDEDCLYLNVHAPDPRPEDAPVLVWIHGGGFVFGEGLQADGGTAGDLLAARHGLVVVSMNYRLGPFGFLSHSALTAEQGASGNYGLADQQAALRWVQTEIAAFGGDPDNVTIVGESAGGTSVCAHMIAPGSEGLFHRAISQSGLCDAPFSPRVDAEAAGADFAAQLGCEGADALACLREASVDEIEAADTGGEVFTELGQKPVWWPSVDGAVLTGDFRARVEAGAIHPVPTIVGWNGDEGTLFVMLAEQAGAVIDQVAYDAAIAALAEAYGVPVDAVRAQYPAERYADLGAAIAAPLGHASLACPSRRAARLLAEAGVDVWTYWFTYPDAAFQLSPSRPLGAFHSAEIQYVFGHPAALGQQRFRGDDIALNDAISGYWARFAWTGDPNGDGAPAWPAHDAAGDRHLVLDRVIEAGTGADADACALWAP